MSTGAAGEPADQLIAGEEIARVRAALARLKSDEQDLIALHFAAGLTVKEAGAAVGKSESTARMRLWRAVRKLRKDLEK